MAIPEPLPEPEMQPAAPPHTEGLVEGLSPDLFDGHEDLTTVWVGGIPEDHPAVSEDQLEDFFDERFGVVDNLTLRIKAGKEAGFWCLVSFADELSATKLMEEGVDLGDAVGGAPEHSCRLIVDRADILTHLKKPNPGALASVWEKMETRKRKLKTSRTSTPVRPSYMDVPAFQQGVDKLWNVMLAEDASSLSSPHAVANRDMISYAQYEALHFRISKTLHTYFSRSLARSVSQQDWNHDTGIGTKDRMTRTQFDKSLGELAELWASEVIGDSEEEPAEGSWKTAGTASVLVRFLNVLYANCTEGENKTRKLKMRLLNVRFISVAGLTDKMAQTEAELQASPKLSAGKQLLQSAAAALDSSDTNGMSPLAGSSENDLSRLGVDQGKTAVAGVKRPPSKPPAAGQMAPPARWNPNTSCGHVPGVPLQYHCERCEARSQHTAERQKKEEDERELAKHLRLAGPIAVAEAMSTGSLGFSQEQLTVSVGEGLRELTWERSWSFLPQGVGHIPKDCHKQGGFVRSSGTHQPGRLAGAAPHAPGTTPLDDPLMLGSISQEFAMGEVESMASMGTVGSYQPSLASLATDATGTSVASVVLPCAHPQYHGRHARPLGPLAVDDTTPHLRQASLTLRQQKQLATSTLAASTPLKNKFKASAAAITGKDLAGAVSKHAMIQKVLASGGYAGVTNLVGGAMAKAEREMGWLPPYGFIVPRPPSNRRPRPPKIGMGSTQSIAGLSRLATPRAAARDALHAPGGGSSLPTLAATIAARRPSIRGQYARTAREPRQHTYGLPIHHHWNGTTASMYAESTTDIHPGVHHPVHNRICPPGKTAAATVRSNSATLRANVPAWTRGGVGQRRGGGSARLLGTAQMLPSQSPLFLSSLRGGADCRQFSV